MIRAACEPGRPVAPARRRAFSPHIAETPPILIVEDEFVVWTLVGDVLSDLGYGTLGPVTTLDAALEVVRSQPIGAALLDVNIQGRSVYPVAEALAAQGTPFAFMTGYRRREIPTPFGHVPVLEKPFDERLLESILRDKLGVAP